MIAFMLLCIMCELTEHKDLIYLLLPGISLVYHSVWHSVGVIIELEA